MGIIITFKEEFDLILNMDAERAKNKGYETKGPVRIPTKILRVTTRKSPCGEGTNTWDRYEMRIHKRVIDIHCPSSVVKDITTFKIDSSIDVALIVWRQ